jgi:hypothetical protein
VSGRVGSTTGHQPVVMSQVVHASGSRAAVVGGSTVTTYTCTSMYAVALRGIMGFTDPVRLPEIDGK